MVVPSVVAALALGVTGTGVGYAVGNARATSGSTDAASGTGSTSTRMLAPGYASGDGQGYGQGYGQGGGYAPQLPQDGQNGSGGLGLQQQVTPQQSSTDTTSIAYGSQLTGLVRVVSTMKYDGSKAAGTGMILTAAGEVVTNHHVVAGATTITVTVMSTGKTYTASVVGTDSSADVAVLQLAGRLRSRHRDAPTPRRSRPATKVTAVGDGNGTVNHLSAATGRSSARASRSPPRATAPPPARA